MLDESDATVLMMGGTVTVVVAHEPGQRDMAARDLRRSIERMRMWTARLTRFDGASELSQLNRDADAPRSRVSPLLSAVLVCAADLSVRSGGAVDVGMLDARLAVEADIGTASAPTHSRWWLERDAGSAWVHRRGRVAFDLDGVTKGWMADRALAMLGRYPAALVDADGDIACRDDVGLDWTIAVADPSRSSRDLLAISLTSAVGRGPIGVATSGTTRHRWGAGDMERHHLIDPRTGRPATGHTVQATVVAGSASIAEGLAKGAIIRDGVPGLLGRDGLAAILHSADGGTRITPGTRQWLAV